MGDQRELRTAHGPWGGYVAVVISIVLVISAASVRAVFGATPACRPIELDALGLPAPALGDLREAAARVTSASHVPFLFVGASAGRDAIHVRTGANPPRIEGGRNVGYAIVQTSGTRIIGGSVSVDLSLAKGYGFGTRAALGAVFMHELGHVVGLGHSRHTEDLMFPRPMPGPAVFSPADLHRLAEVGRQLRCEGAARPTESRRS